MHLHLTATLRGDKVLGENSSVSPAMAAAAAIHGHFVDVSKI